MLTLQLSIEVTSCFSYPHDKTGTCWYADKLINYSNYQVIFNNLVKKLNSLLEETVILTSHSLNVISACDFLLRAEVLNI